MTEPQGRSVWAEGPPGRVVVAVAAGGTVVGTAKMGPNRSGPGAHVSTATFLVAAGHRGQGVGTVDVGRVVNPDGVRNQIEGGVTQATSWTLKKRVRFDRRRVTSVDWETYPILRFSEAPEVVVELVEDRDEPSTGAGEAAQGPTAAAIGNAVAAALGIRVRTMPLTREAVIRALDA